MAGPWTDTATVDATELTSPVESAAVVGIADDDHVSIAFTVSGTHLGDFNGIPPSGRTFKASGVEIFRFANGQVVERWGLTDDMGILGQLGLVSPPH